MVISSCQNLLSLLTQALVKLFFFVYWYFVTTSPITFTFAQCLLVLASSAKIRLSIAASGWLALDYLLNADTIYLVFLIICLITTIMDIDIVCLYSKGPIIYKTKETRLCGCSV